PTQADYSTIFFWNIFLSLFFYGVLYLSSPLIAKFYEIPLLSNVLKVQGLILVLNALILIQQNILKKQVNFKKIAKINIGAITIGTSAGIATAFLGFGVWSLVIKSLTTGVIQCIIYWLSSHWKPQWRFSGKSFISLFKFGSFMFLNGICNNLYYNIISLILGKNFSATSLGYYTQAKKVEDIPRNSLSSVITNVTFPVFSEMQNDLPKLRETATKCMKSIAVINFPLMILLIMIAKPLFILLFTDKWVQAIPYFQILCLSGVATTLFELNTNIIKSLGKSQLTFILETMIRVIGVIAVVIGINWGVTGMLYGYTFSQYIAYVITAIWVGKLTKYGVVHQCKNLFPIFFAAVIPAIISYLISLFIETEYALLLTIQTVVYTLLYFGISKLCNIKEINILIAIIREKIIGIKY
ncbi:MAG: lipopolysaccharide biosynthesis protein, partial [Bacteroidales bacterium]